MIIIINFAENSLTLRARRHVSLKESYIKRGYQVKLVSSDFDHGKKIKIANTKLPADEYLVPVKGYKTNYSVARIISHQQFALRIFLLLLLQKNLDRVISSSIPPEATAAAAIACKLKGAKLFVDIRDTWPASWAAQKGLKSSLFEVYCNFFNKIWLGITTAVTYTNKDFLDLVNIPVRARFVPLGYDASRWSNMSSSKKRSGAVYIGNFNSQFDLRVMGAQIHEFLSTSIVTLIGDGELRNIYNREFGVANFTGLIDYDSVANQLSSYEYGLLPISGKATFPNKIYDYAFAGLHIMSNDKSVLESIKLPNTEIQLLQSNTYLLKNEFINFGLFHDYDETTNQMIDFYEQFST